MKFTLPFVYPLEVKMLKNTRPSLRFPETVVSADISEVADEDAPVVVTIRSNERNFTHLTKFRKFHGEFYAIMPLLSGRTCTSTEGYKIGVDSFLELIGKALKCEHRTDMRHSMYSLVSKGVTDKPMPDSSSVEHILYDGLEDTRAAVQAGLESLLIVDKELWYRVSEPKLVLDKPKESYQAVLSITTSSYRYDDGFQTYAGWCYANLPGTSQVFSLLDHEEAVEISRGLGAYNGTWEASTLSRVDDIIIHDPSAIEFDRHAHSADLIIDFFIKKTWESTISWASEDIFTLVHARDCLKKYRSEADTSYLFEGLSSLESLLNSKAVIPRNVKTKVIAALSHCSLMDTDVRIVAQAGINLG